MIFSKWLRQASEFAEANAKSLDMECKMWDSHLLYYDNVLTEPTIEVVNEDGNYARDGESGKSIVALT